jgi:hypothetical protein
MHSKDRVGHNEKRKPQHDPAEKKQIRRAEKQAVKSGKRKRRAATAHARHPDG